MLSFKINKLFLNKFIHIKPNRLSINFLSCSSLPYFLTDDASNSNIISFNFNDNVDLNFLDTYKRDSIFFLKTSNLNLLDNFYSNLFLNFKDVSLFYKILEID
jgi:hypothetical protein